MNKIKIVCLVSESGGGKSTLAEAMEPYGYYTIDSYTTRLPRHANEKGHIFVDQNSFDRIRDHLVAYTMFNGFEYGVTLQQIDDHHLYVVDPDGVDFLRNHLEQGEILVVYLESSLQERLKRMIDARGIDAACERVEHDIEKYSAFHHRKAYDLVLQNQYPEDLKRNILLLRSILDGIFDGTGGNE